MIEFTATKQGDRNLVRHIKSGNSVAAMPARGISHHVFSGYIVQCNESGEIVSVVTVRGQKPPLVCEWLGVPIEEILTVSVFCDCNGNPQWRKDTYVIHDCAMFGKCVPAYACTPQAIAENSSNENVAPCKFCIKNPNNPENLNNKEN